MWLLIHAVSPAFLSPICPGVYLESLINKQSERYNCSIFAVSNMQIMFI